MFVIHVDGCQEQLSKLETEQRRVYGDIHNKKNELHLQLIKKEEELKSMQRHIEMLNGEVCEHTYELILFY